MGPLAHKCRDALEPPDRRPIPAWAAEHVQLFPPLTKTGPFSIEESRHFAAPFESLQSDSVREVNIVAPVRGGKTLIADVWINWLICEQPGPTLWVFQEDKAAKDQALLRTWQYFEKIPEIRAKLPESLHEVRTQKIHFPAMPLHIVGPAESNLQSRGYQNVILDEPWQYKFGKLEEARGRLGDFVRMGTEKLLCISQGGEVNGDWERQCSRAVMNEWEVPCLNCGHYAPAIWTGHRSDGSRYGMAWDTHKEPSGLWLTAQCLPTVRWECEKCGHAHIWGASLKAEWNRRGRYAQRETQNLSTRQTYHWTSIIDYPWDQLLDLYLQAINAWKLGVVEPLIQFFQKRMGEHKNENALLENRLNFRRATYEVTGKAADGCVRAMTADRQAEEVYWVVAREWEMKTGKSKRIFFGKLFSDADIEKKRTELEINPRHVMIDSGYQPKGDHGVYRSCIRYRWIPVKGVATEGGEPITFTHRLKNGVTAQRSYSEPIVVDSEIGTGSAGQRYVEMARFSSPTYADRLENLIDRGLWLEPEGLDGDPLEREYRAQMAAEYKRSVKVGSAKVGKTRSIWVCPSGNNHAKDCNKMQVLLATLLGILPDID